MSCNSCLRKYGFLCKETGCPNCGFSFCTKCLKKTIEVPRLDGAPHKVCLTCWDKLSKQKSMEAPQSPGVPPEIQSPIDEPIPAEIQANLDEIIQQRLDALKKPDQPIESDEAIAIRVANLKDIPYHVKDNSDLLHKIDTRSDEEKTADLIKQFLGEVGIDQKVDDASDPVKEIEKRLAALRDDKLDGSDRKNSNSENEEEDEETKIKKLTQKYLDEAQLPDHGLNEEEKEFIESTKSDKPLEQLPWCHICNEDATVRCLDCDGDLFCRSCFKEFHVDEDDRNHQTEAYVANQPST